MLGLLIPPDGQVSAVAVRPERRDIDALVGLPSAWRDKVIPGVGACRVFYQCVDRSAGVEINAHLVGLLGREHFRASPVLPGVGLVLRFEARGTRGLRRITGLTVNDCLAIAIAIVRNERLELEA